MRKFCSPGARAAGGMKGSILGIVLMALGVIMLLLFVPYWVWTSVLSVLLISIGFLIWRFRA